MENDLSMFVPKVHFEQIPIKNLVSNQQYQRNVYLRHVKEAARNFDLYQINPVKVSRRDGINYVFNGQHTIEIVAMVSKSRETPVWCMIYDDLEYQHEADIFANQMKYVKPLLAYEIFMAHVEADSDKHVLIKKLVESYNLFLSSCSRPNGICAVSAIERVYDKYGLQVLDRVLRLLAGTWEGASQSLTSGMIGGMARLVNCYGDDLNDNVFKERMGLVSVKEIIRTAKERRRGSLGYAEALILAYNKNCRTQRLSFNRLYKNKQATLIESESGLPLDAETADI